MSVQVIDAPERRRYEVVHDGSVLGFAAYERTEGLIVFTHTEVDPTLEGQGIGGAVVQGALDNARQLGLKVLALCPFVHGWLLRHPEYADLDYSRPASKVTD
jgi:predicted GNAT family acetyltransferase